MAKQSNKTHINKRRQTISKKNSTRFRMSLNFSLKLSREAGLLYPEKVGAGTLGVCGGLSKD